MAKKRNRRRDNFNDVPVDPPKTSGKSVGYVLGGAFEDLCCTEYTSLDKCPEIIAGVKRIADLIGSMTIHLMANTASGQTCP